MNESNLKTAVNFYLLATSLKYKLRAGWDQNHWCVDKERLESIAEHIYGTCILALAIDSEFECNVDLNKVLKMLVIHELGEVIIGDITPYDNITPLEKQEMEHKAFISVIGDLVKKDELIKLMLEFDERKTKEAIFAYYCDKLEADIQCKVYQDMGCQKSLYDHPDTNVYKNDKVQKIVANGAQTVFDIWYENEKSIYDINSPFYKFLDFIKENNTNI